MLAAAPVAFLFAPGAGASITSPWMQHFAERLARLGRVQGFDYPYRLEGRRAPDRLPVLQAAHRAAYSALREQHAGPIFLAGKSMGGRVGCHVADDVEPGGAAGVICFGYPLVGQNGAVRDSVLRELQRPALFVQGSRDSMCPLDQLEALLPALPLRHRLHVVEGGDHSLLVTKTLLKRQGRTQALVDDAILSAVADFVTAQSG